MQKAVTYKDTCIPVFIAAIYSGQDMEAKTSSMEPRCPLTDEWIKRL